MIIAVIMWGPIGCFAVGFVLSLIFCLIVLEMHLQSSKRGFDVTGVEHMKEWANQPHSTQGSRLRQTFSRLLRNAARVFIGSYWLMIIFGSVFFIECDYVTILLRKKGEGRLSVIFRVMIPSVTWGIAMWTLFYWAAWEFSNRLFKELTGCSGIECLANPDWQWAVNGLRFAEACFHHLQQFFG